MNALIDNFPTKIKVNNHIYDIDSDFRNCIRIIQAYEDKELMPEEKAYILIKRLYIEEVSDEDIEQALMKGIKFLDLAKKDNKNKISERVYSFSKDSSYIYTGINQAHHIDLQEVKYMHWWKFVYLFMDIGEDCMFNQLIYYRKRYNDGKLSKEEKEIYNSARDIFDLDYDPEPSEEKKEFLRKLNGGVTTRNS